MERQTSLSDLLDECQVDVSIVGGMLDRLQKFTEPFALCLQRQEQMDHLRQCLGGLLSNLNRKNAESIAYRYDLDRKAIQHFVGTSPWDHKPLIAELRRQVAETIGEADAVLVFDPSGVVKCGKSSVGVARQWIGRVGKIENGQVGIYLGYVGRQAETLIDHRLFLPQEWTRDRKRCRRGGVPKEVRFQTRHDLALAMLDEHGAHLPHAWVAGDDEMGRSARFRGDLRQRQQRYVLAVPSNTKIHDLEAPPVLTASGRQKRYHFQQVRTWREQLAEEAWTTVEICDGAKGPLRVSVISCRVIAQTKRAKDRIEERLVIIRTQAGGSVKYDYYLSNAAADVPLAELARVAQAEHRIEECFRRAKSEAGLADYEVRTWIGWHHHQTLALLSMWFLVRETLEGKKRNASDHRSADPGDLGDALVLPNRHWQTNTDRRRSYSATRA